MERGLSTSCWRENKVCMVYNPWIRMYMVIVSCLYFKQLQILKTYKVFVIILHICLSLLWALHIDIFHRCMSAQVHNSNKLVVTKIFSLVFWESWNHFPSTITEAEFGRLLQWSNRSCFIDFDISAFLMTIYSSVKACYNIIMVSHCAGKLLAK